MCKTCKEIREQADAFLSDAKDFIEEKARTHIPEFDSVGSMSKADLARNINAPGITGALVRARLAGKKISEWGTVPPEALMQGLWDQAFDVDVYKSIGVNDGILLVVRKIYETLGDEAKSKEASSWMYSD